MEELAASVDLFLSKPRAIENQKLICAACARIKQNASVKGDRRDRKDDQKKNKTLTYAGRDARCLRALDAAQGPTLRLPAAAGP